MLSTIGAFWQYLNSKTRRFIGSDSIAQQLREECAEIARKPLKIVLKTGLKSSRIL